MAVRRTSLQIASEGNDSRRGALINNPFALADDAADIWDSDGEDDDDRSDINDDANPSSNPSSKPSRRAKIATIPMRIIARKLICGMRMKPRPDGVNLAEIHDRSLQRYEMRWNPPSNNEKDYIDAVLRATDLMFKMTSLVRDVGHASRESAKRGFDKATCALNKCKLYTMRHIWSLHIEPLNEKMTKMRIQYESLKKQFDVARNQYLNEVSSLRSEVSKRRDPNADLFGTGADDIRYWYDPASSLSEEELSFVAKVVKEQVKMIVQINPNASASSNQLDALTKQNDNNQVRHLQSQLATKDEEIHRLNSTIRELQKASSGSNTGAPAQSGAPSKLLEALEGDLDDLRSEVRSLRKERQALLDLKQKSEIESAEMQGQLTESMEHVDMLTEQLHVAVETKNNLSLSVDESNQQVKVLEARVAELEEKLRQFHKRLSVNSFAKSGTDRRASISARTIDMEQKRASLQQAIGDDIEQLRFSSKNRSSIREAPAFLPDIPEPGIPCQENPGVSKGISKNPESMPSGASTRVATGESLPENFSRASSRVVTAEQLNLPENISSAPEVEFETVQREPTEFVQDVASKLHSRTYDVRPATVEREVLSPRSLQTPRQPQGRLMRGSPRRDPMTFDHARMAPIVPQKPASGEPSRGQHQQSPQRRRSQSPSQSHPRGEQSKGVLRDASGRPLTRDEITSLINFPRAAREFKESGELSKFIRQISHSDRSATTPTSSRELPMARAAASSTPTQSISKDLPMPRTPAPPDGNRRRLGREQFGSSPVKLPSARGPASSERSVTEPTISIETCAPKSSNPSRRQNARSYNDDDVKASSNRAPSVDSLCAIMRS